MRLGSAAFFPPCTERGHSYSSLQIVPWRSIFHACILIPIPHGISVIFVKYPRNLSPHRLLALPLCLRPLFYRPQSKKVTNSQDESIGAFLRSLFSRTAWVEGAATESPPVIMACSFSLLPFAFCLLIFFCGSAAVRYARCPRPRFCLPFSTHSGPTRTLQGEQFRQHTDATLILLIAPNPSRQTLCPSVNQIKDSTFGPLKVPPKECNNGPGWHPMGPVSAG